MTAMAISSLFCTFQWQLVGLWMSALPFQLSFLAFLCCLKLLCCLKCFKKGNWKPSEYKLYMSQGLLFDLHFCFLLQIVLFSLSSSTVLQSGHFGNAERCWTVPLHHSSLHKNGYLRSLATVFSNRWSQIVFHIQSDLHLGTPQPIVPGLSSVRVCVCGRVRVCVVCLGAREP